MAVPGALGPVAPARARRGCSARRPLLASAWVIVPLLAPVPLGGAQPGAGGHRARERLRRAADAVVADHRQPLRQRPLAARLPIITILVGRRHRRVHLAAGAPSSPAAPSWPSGSSRSSCRSGGRRSGRSTTSSPAAATSSSGASKWACSSRASCWPASASSSWAGSSSGARWRCSPRTRRGWAAQPAGRGIVAGLCIVALVVVLAPGLEQHGHLRRPQRDQHRPPGGRRRAAGPPDRPAAGLRARPPQGTRLRRSADELGQRLPRRGRPRLQVPREQGHRRGRLHAAHGVAHDRPRVLLRRDQPGRLPALRHRLHHHARRHGGAGRGGQGRLCSGDYCLWALPDAGYIHVYDTTGVLTATRADVGTQSTTLLDSPLLDEQRDLTVAFNGQAASTPTATDASTLRGSPGHVVVGARRPGRTAPARAVVHTNRRATVVLSASYDPGWHATVERPPGSDRHGGARAGRGRGRARACTRWPSRYDGYGSYDALFVLALVVLVVLAVAPLAWRRHAAVRRSTARRSEGTMGEP